MYNRTIKYIIKFIFTKINESFATVGGFRKFVKADHSYLLYWLLEIETRRSNDFPQKLLGREHHVGILHGNFCIFAEK